MAIIPGQNLISNSEHANRRNFAYSPQAGFTTNTRNNNNLLTGLRDFGNNALFNVFDSALFGIPSGRMSKNIETHKDGILSLSRESYGEKWDALGIKPYHELSGAGKFGLGLGQAAGFFIPFSGISKTTTAIQRSKALFGSNTDKLFNLAIKDGVSGLNGLPGTSAVESAIKGVLESSRKTIPYIYRTTPEQYVRFSQTLTQNINTAVSKALEGSAVPPAQIRGVTETVVKKLEQFGKDRKYIDNLPDYISSFGMIDGRGKIAANLFGYVGRAVDQSINMVLYEGLGQIARASAGAKIEGIDYNFLDSAKHSAGFAAAISLADFIPGGRRAGMFQDFYKFARQSLKPRRNFTEMFEKGLIDESQMRVLATYFGRMANTRVAGASVSELKAGRASGNSLAMWLDDIYSKNKKELLSAIMKDGGKSLVGSLLRAAVDGVITAVYLNGAENFMHAIHDESMIGDYLVGAFMAMRSHQPLNPRRAMRYRYDNSIDSRFDFMRQMGMDVSTLKKNIPHYTRMTLDAEFSAKNLETIDGHDKIYNVLYDRGELADSEGSRSGEMDKRAFLQELHVMFMSSYIRNKAKDNENAGVTKESIDLAYSSGNLPQIYAMSDAQINAMWNKIKDIETSTGRSIDSYAKDGDFTRFYEDFMKPAVENHKDYLLRTTAELSDLFGLTKANRLIDNGELIIKEYTYNGNNDKLSYFVQMMNQLQSSGKVKVEKGSVDDVVNLNKFENDAEKMEKFEQIADNYHDTIETYMDANFRYESNSNPSIDFIARHNRFSTLNRMKEAVRGDFRQGDKEQKDILTAIDSVFKENQIAMEYEIKIVPDADKKDSDGKYEMQLQRIEQLNELFSDIANMKIAANGARHGKKIYELKFSDAEAAAKTLENAHFVSWDRNNNSFLYAGMEASHISNLLRRDNIRRVGLNEMDFIVMEALKVDYSKSDGRIELPSVDLMRQILNTDEHGTTRMPAEDAKTFIDEYASLLNRLVKTNQVDTAESISLDSRERAKLLGTVNYIREIYSQKVKADIGELKSFTERIVENNNKIRAILDDIEKREGEIYEDGNRQIRLTQAEIEELSALYGQRAELISMSFSDGSAFAKSIAKSFESIEAIRNSGSMVMESALFANEMRSIRGIETFNSAVANLVNIESSSEAMSVAGMRLRAKIMSEYTQLKAEQISRAESNLTELIYDFARDVSYDKAVSIVNEANRIIRNSIGSVDNSYTRHMTEMELRDLQDMLASSISKSTMQTFITRLRNLGLDNLLSDDKKRMSESFVGRLSNEKDAPIALKELHDTLKSTMGKDFETQRNDIINELRATVESINLRDDARTVMRLDGESVVVRQEKNAVRTPVNDFVKSLNQDGTSAVLVKNEFIDSRGKLVRLSDEGMSMSQIENTFSTAFNQYRDADRETALKEKLKDKQTADFINEFARQVEESKSKSKDDLPQNPLFVPLQASDDIGIVFYMNERNIQKVKDKLFHLNKLIMEDSSISDSRKAQWSKTYENIEKFDKKEQVAWALRSLFNYHNIGKEFFFRTVGETTIKDSNGNYLFDKQSAIAGQSKVTKYIHHVNNTNATAYTGEALRIVAHAVDTFSDGNSRYSEISSALRRRADEGVRALAYNDEANSSPRARDLVERSIRERNPGISNERLRELVDATIRENEKDIKALDQSLTDGSLYASKEAMLIDTFLMGEDFYNGARAAKFAHHTTEGYGSIWKGASRFDPKVADAMKRLGIDYLVPNSVAKIMFNKDSNYSFENFDTTKDLADNIDSNIDGFLNSSGYVRFGSDGIKYMFSGHGFGHKSNSNSSVTHFWDYDALRDYSERLDIDNIAERAISIASRALNPNIQFNFAKMQMERLQDVKNNLSHTTYLEQLMEWGIQSDNTLIRDSIMRAFRDKLYGSAVSRSTDAVSNTFLFSDHRLSSPIYDSFGGDNFVRQLGEVKLSSDVMKRRMDSRDTTIVFELNGVDYVMNSGTGTLDVFTPSTRDNNSKRIKENEKLVKALNDLYKTVSTVDFENAHQFLQNLNRNIETILNNPTYFSDLKLETKNPEITLALRIANELVKTSDTDFKSLGNFAIGVNLHKIPKKFAPDSIINRVKGFVDKEKGNITELNNYEIALQHQADQDGDKITTYLNNPFSSVVRSLKNMGLTKEPQIIDRSKPIAPNMYGSIDGMGNMLDYISQERQSKFIVGSTVKMQGVFTMLNSLGIEFASRNPFVPSDANNKPELMDSLIDGETAKDFQKIVGSITQSILDAWTGVNEGLLKAKTVKDFLLFGEKSEHFDFSKMPDAFKRWHDRGGLFKMPDSLSNQQKKVYKDVLSRFVSRFEDAYSSFADTIEGGTRQRPTYDVLANIYHRLNKVLDNGLNPIYKELLYVYNKRGDRESLQALNSFMRGTNENTNKTLPRSFININPKGADGKRVGEGARIIYKAYPQLRALEVMVTKTFGIDNPDYLVKLSDEYNRFMEDIDNLDGIKFLDSNSNMDNIDVFNESNIILVKNEIHNLFESVRKRVENESNNNLSSSDLRAPERLGVLMNSINVKIGQLKRSADFFSRTGNIDRASELFAERERLQTYLDNLNINMSNALRDAVNNKNISKAHLNKGWYNNNTNKNHYVYSVGRNGEYVFEGVVQAGSSRRFFGDKNFISLRNPLHFVSDKVNTTRANEGLAMERSTQDIINKYVLDVKENRTPSINESILANRVVGLKMELRKVSNDSYDRMNEYPHTKSEMYSHQEYYSDLLISRFIDDVYSKNPQAFLNEISSVQSNAFMIAHLLSPRVMPETFYVTNSNDNMPYYKIDNQFVKQLVQFSIRNKDNAKYQMFNAALEAIMRDFEMVKQSFSRGQLPVRDMSTLDTGFREMDIKSWIESPGSTLLGTLNRMRSQNFFLDKAMRDIKSPHTFDGETTFYRTEQHKDIDKICPRF